MIFKYFCRDTILIKKLHMTTAAECYLIPSDNTLSKINIPPSTEVIVGRSRETNIRDRRCSKKQLSLLADYTKSELFVKCIGSNPAAIDGKQTKNNTQYVIKNGSVIEAVAGTLKYSVLFKYVFDGVGSKKSKRTGEEESDQVSFKQIKMDVNSWKGHFCNALLEYTSSDFIYKNKVASFDLDNTLIKTKSGYVFPKDPSDWILWNARVKTVLSELNRDGYMLVIFTNQAGLAPPNGMRKISDFKSKIEAIVSELAVPIKVYVSTSYGLYRKPAPGMWNFLLNSCSLPVVKEDSFYVGDAAGRDSNWKLGKKKDFSISDKLFALNLNLKFYTPEEYFLGEPKSLCKELSFIPGDFNLTVEPNYKTSTVKQEVILMVGSPASGKSNFVNKKLVPNGYINVSRDNLGSWQKCVKDLELELGMGRSVVIDNTNPDAASRERYVQVCKKLNVPIRCFVMDCSLDRALHNNAFRTIKDKSHQVVNAKIIQMFYTNLEEPRKEEGFSEIIYVPFVPYFQSDEDRELYLCHLFCK